MSVETPASEVPPIDHSPTPTASEDQPPTSILEKYATDVAREVGGGNDSLVESDNRAEELRAEGLRGFDISLLIPLIMTIVQSLLQNCPQPAPQVRGSFKRPTLRQRAALMKMVRESCECCNQRRHAGKIYQSLLIRGSNIQDADATALIKECADDQNLLI